MRKTASGSTLGLQGWPRIMGVESCLSVKPLSSLRTFAPTVSLPRDVFLLFGDVCWNIRSIHSGFHSNVAFLERFSFIILPRPPSYHSLSPILINFYFGACILHCIIHLLSPYKLAIPCNRMTASQRQGFLSVSFTVVFPAPSVEPVIG